MTTIQVKLRHSGVQGKAGTIYYQITRGRKTRRIATHLRIAPEHWLPAAQRIAPAISQTPEGRLLRHRICLLYTSPSPRDLSTSRMPSSA